MAKYYVTSGKVRRVVEAPEARSAALWTIHVAMESVEGWDELDLSDDLLSDLQDLNVDGLSRFDQDMVVSEIGFDRSEAGRFDAIELLIEWNQLLTALARLERIIDSAE